MSEVWKMPQLGGQEVQPEALIPMAPAPGGGVVDLTRKLASAILAKAHQQADGIRQAATAEGRQQGRTEGLKQMELELAREKAALQEAHLAKLRELEEIAAHHRLELEQKVESGLLDALLGLAGVNLAQLLRNNPKALYDSIKEAVNTLSVNGSVNIQLHPTDSAVLAELSSFPPNWTVHPDATVEQGGFVVQGDQGEIDGQWSAREAHWRTQLAG